MTIRGRNGFLCDDVRQEANGKYIFIGAYAGAVEVQDFPYDISPQLVMFLESKGGGKYRIEIETTLDGKRISLSSGDIEAVEDGLSFVPVGLGLPPIHRAGMLRVRFREVGKTWDEVLRTPIELVAPAPNSQPT